ncbi:CLUMA_CG019534, isoform A [Clunio marinus]|uniref:CLUMA_CG019534, isoform A n=1 Tax=Clunio marinus TaxID=568069 RepID=A0A1J1J395_9DIPT|nr:CLUMA_CG019534, isoform A [Clunio marinus]
MSILDLRPSPADLSDIPFILEQLNIMDSHNNNSNDGVIANDSFEDEEEEYDGRNSLRRSVDERALVPRISSLENSLVGHIHNSIPSLDEMVIRQRGRKKQPAKISWSPVKSPFKTPTKKSSSLHMSLLSPSPAKNLFNNSTSMTLRSSPRKRIFVDAPSKPTTQNPTTSTPTMTPPKRFKFFNDNTTNRANDNVPIRTLLKGLDQDQLINIICDISSQNSAVEESVRKNLPLPDIRSYEEKICELRKSITRSSPRSRLLSKTDGAAFSRASPHLIAFKKAIYNHCKILNDSQHYEALIDYILMVWPYVRALPLWDDVSHNILRKDCFKVLTLNARSAIRNGGMKLSLEKVKSFRCKLSSMAADHPDILKCHDALVSLGRKLDA